MFGGGCGGDLWFARWLDSPREAASLKCDEERKPLNDHAKVTGTKAFVCPVRPSPTAQETVDAKKVYDSEKRRRARTKRKTG